MGENKNKQTKNYLVLFNIERALQTSFSGITGFQNSVKIVYMMIILRCQERVRSWLSALFKKVRKGS